METFETITLYYKYVLHNIHISTFYVYVWSSQKYLIFRHLIIKTLKSRYNTKKTKSTTKSDREWELYKYIPLFLKIFEFLTQLIFYRSISVFACLNPNTDTRLYIPLVVFNQLTGLLTKNGLVITFGTALYQIYCTRRTFRHCISLSDARGKNILKS